MDERAGTGEVSASAGAGLRLCTLGAQSSCTPQRTVPARGGEDGRRSLIEWKTTASRYSEAPDGLLALDPQLVCYSWMTGISDVALVVFVRKRLVEVQ